MGGVIIQMPDDDETTPSQGGLALTIGVSSYRNPDLNLPGAVQNDAVDLASVLRDRCGYSPARVRTLVNEAATLDQIRGGLSWLAQSAGENDLVVILFSGHGLADNDTGLLIPWGYDGTAASALSHYELTEALDKIHAGRLILIVDTCHASAMAGIRTRGRRMKAGPLLELARQRPSIAGQRMVLCSSLSDEDAHTHTTALNSFFVEALLGGMRGGARYTNGMLLYGAVFDYVSNAFRTAGNIQTPKSEATANFPIALSGMFGPKKLDSSWQGRARAAYEVLDLGAVRIANRRDAAEAYRLAKRPGLSDANRLKCLKAAAALGHGPACFDLGCEALAGVNVPASPEEAEKWWREGHDQGDDASAFQLWKLLKNVAATNAMAVEFLRHAASNGLPEARFELAALEVKSDDTAVRTRALKALTRLSASPAPAAVQIKAKLEIAFLMAAPGWAYDCDKAMALATEVLRSETAAAPQRQSAANLRRYLNDAG